MTTPLYEVSALRRSYVRGSVAVHAVDYVDLDVRAGELLAIEGSSGSGKSTLLAMLGGLDRPSSGSIRFDGVELSDMSDRDLTNLRARHIGFIFQGFNLIPTLSAVQNVEAVMAPLRLSRATQRAAALDLLDKVGLSQRADHLPSTLSGGEQQRVAVARALANGPRVVLADEPTGNLDSTTAAEVVKLLRSLTEDLGVTIVLVTHDRELAAQAPRRILMRDGHIVGASRPERHLAAVPATRTPSSARLRVERAPALIGRAAAVIALAGVGGLALHASSGSSALSAASGRSLSSTAPETSSVLSGVSTPDPRPSHPALVVQPKMATTSAKPPAVVQTTPAAASRHVEGSPVTSAITKPVSVKIPVRAIKPVKAIVPKTPVTPPTTVTTTTTTGTGFGGTGSATAASLNPWQPGWWFPWNWMSYGNSGPGAGN